MSAQVILVTGGTGKVGHSLVKHFLGKGDIVVTTARRQWSLDNLIAKHPDSKSRLIGIVADFTTPNAIEKTVQQLASRGIKPDRLVNNARSLDFLEVESNGMVSRSNFVNEFLISVFAPYELTMALAWQADSKLKRVVNIGSQYGSVAANRNLYSDFQHQSPIHYSVAKAALAHLTRELAVRLAEKNIQVNCVAFGGIEGRVDAAFKERYVKLCPMGRMLTDSEVAGPVDMLLSESCSGMTGHIMAVDGGWCIW